MVIAADSTEDTVYKATINFAADPSHLRCTCASCTWQGPASRLDPIEDCSLTPSDPSPAGRCPRCNELAYVVQDVAVLPRRALERQIAPASAKPWLGQLGNGCVFEFDTEDQARAFQRAWRRTHGMDETSGAPARQVQEVATFAALE